VLRERLAFLRVGLLHAHVLPTSTSACCWKARTPTPIRRSPCHRCQWGSVIDRSWRRRFANMRGLLSSRTGSLRVRLPNCYGRGNYDWSSRIRCRMRLAGPMELTSTRIGTSADMFCQGKCKRWSSSQSLTTPNDFKHDHQTSQTGSRLKPSTQCCER